MNSSDKYNIPCGTSSQRNLEYEKNFSPLVFFSSLITNKTSPLVIDVGAHRGESISFFKNLFPNSEIFSFEPIKENFDILSEIASQERTHVYQMAVSDFCGKTTFYMQDISHIGSLQPINNSSTDSLGYASRATNAEVEVLVTTIDSFCTEKHINHVDILKIDVQSHEVAALRGALNTLKFTDCVSIEISLYDFYKTKNSSLLEVELIMNQSGFKLWDISKVSKNPKNFRTDWIEAIYIRN